ncbi:SAM-dependent methyltransferase [soil metagenome]
MSTGTLYLVPTLLGPAPLAGSIPADVALLAARLDYYVAENARTARASLQALPLTRPIQSIEIRELDVRTPDADLPALLAPILAGRDGGLISEAGCPAVADPGAKLVELAHRGGVRVAPLVGPSSLLLALMASGLNGQSFAFLGYLPSDAAARDARLAELEQLSRRTKQTQIFIETPYRNAALLDAMVRVLAKSTRVCVATDLTLPSESIRTMPAPQWAGVGGSLNKRPSVFLLLA